MKKVNIIIVICILLVVLVKRNESFIWKVLSRLNIVDDYIYFENKSSRYPDIDIMWKTPDCEFKRSFVVGESALLYKANKMVGDVTDASNTNYLGFYYNDRLFHVSGFSKLNGYEKAYVMFYLVDLDADHTLLLSYSWQRGKYYITYEEVGEALIEKNYRKVFQRCLH